jgi:hypothetical protein
MRNELAMDDWQFETDVPGFGVISAAFTLIGLAMAVAGLWVWGRAAEWAWTQGAARPEIMTMAIQCAAGGLIAAAELVWVSVVVNRVYPVDGFSRLLQWMGTGAMLIAWVSAAALAWAGW